MKKKIIGLGISAFLVMVFSVEPTFSQPPTPTPSCVGDYDHNGQYHRKGEHYRYIYGGQAYECVACGGCTPVNSKSGGMSALPHGGAGSSEQFAQQMMGSLLGSLFQSILAPPQPDTSYQQRLLKQQMEKQRQEAEKKQAMERWKKLRKEEEARLAEEEALKRRRGQELLAKMGRTGGGQLEPFTWETGTLKLQPIGTGTYDTSGYTSWQRMLCAAYFSSKALEAARIGNPERAEFMNRQSDNVASGAMTEVECRLPGLQQLANIQRQNLKQNKRLTEMVKLLPTIQAKARHLQEIEIKLNEAKKQKADAGRKLEEAKVKVEEAKAQAGTARTQEEKTEADDLLQQALALQQEAEAQVEKARQAEKEYAEMKEKEMQELKGMQEKITAAKAGQ